MDELSERRKSAPRYPRVWFDDASADTTNDDYLKGIIAARSLALIYGPSGDGKTFFTIDILAHIAAGIGWRGLRVRQCLCVYVAAEAGASVLRRFVAWRERALSESREDRIPLAIITRGANLLNAPDVEALIVELRSIAEEARLPLGIVVFDTLSRSTPGGEEGPLDMGLAIAVADRLRDELKATTIFVHHTGKDATKGARGHSSLHAAADTVISVVERTATVEKARDGLTGEGFPFGLEVVEMGQDQDGDPITTCIVVPTDAAPPKMKGREPTGVAMFALLTLKEAISEHGRTMPGTSTIPKGVQACEIGQWRDRFALRYGIDGKEKRDPEAVRKAFTRGREALLGATAVGISGTYVWATR